jgi:8-oxo-dGTP diphosphatase
MSGTKRRLELVEFTNMCAILNKNTNQVVVQERIKSWKGIAFPGGHVEFGEGIITSTIREIKEETGLDISNLKLCGIKDCYDFDKEKRYIVFLLYTSDFTGKLLSETDEGKVYWQDIQTLRKLKLSPDFEEMIDIMLENKYSEFFYEKESNEWVKKLF